VISKVFFRIIYFPIRIIDGIKYFLKLFGGGLRFSIRYGVFPEWIRKHLNIWKIK
jgi:hypothetical protein